MIREAEQTFTINDDIPRPITHPVALTLNGSSEASSVLSPRNINERRASGTAFS
jgi:hypothetical protein